MKNVLLVLISLLCCYSSFAFDNSNNLLSNNLAAKNNQASSYSSSIVNCWIDEFAKAERWINGMRPTVTSRCLAYIYMGAYETALPAMPNYVSNSKYFPEFKTPQFTYKLKKLNWDVALNEYFAKVDSFFLLGSSIQSKTAFTITKDSINAILQENISKNVFQNSKNWGLLMAMSVIDFAKKDLIAEKQKYEPYPTSYSIENKPGLWIGEKHGGYKAFTPEWGLVKTFTSFGSDLLSPPPPPYSTDVNSQYFKDNFEVYNDWKTMNQEKRWKAEFWGDDIVNLSFGPSTRLIVIAKQMVNQSNLNLENALHLYCKLGIGLNDAMVACWKNKYIYQTERPWQFIRKNIDSTYQSIMGESVNQAGKNPPFPGYPSGHSTCAGVGEIILANFFGEKYIMIDSCHADRTDFMGMPRTFETMKQMADENAYSRIPMGAHVRFDCDEGLRLGRLIGTNVNNYSLKLK